jgi:Sulfotransferase family
MKFASTKQYTGPPVPQWHMLESYVEAEIPGLQSPGPALSKTVAIWGARSIASAGGRLPNFFIVGSGKSGTTSLYFYLDQHPQIYMSPIKEPSFFDSEARPEYFTPAMRPSVRKHMAEASSYIRGPMSEKRLWGPVAEWDDYRQLFRNVRDERAVGEASAHYLYSKTAAANIASGIPSARILMILRNPVERAYSQYLHAVTNGLVRRSFAEQLRISLRPSSEGMGVLRPHLEYGLYSEQLERYLAVFPREQLKVFLYEEWSDKAALLRETFRFLGVDNSFHVDFTRKHMEPRVPRAEGLAYLLKQSGMWNRLASATPQSLRPSLRSAFLKPRGKLEMDPADQQFLRDYYRADILKLSKLIDRDLSGWLG